MSYVEFPTRIELFSKGTKVYKRTKIGQKRDARIFVIQDCAIISDLVESEQKDKKILSSVDTSDLSTLVSGTIYYHIQLMNSLKEGEWVPSYSVSALPVVEDEVQQPHQKDLDPDIVAQAFDMVSWRAGLPARPDNSRLADVVTLLMAIQYDKEGGYGSSWKGKGEYRGIMSNIDRKYDRLDKITNDEIEGTKNPLSEQERLLHENYELYSEQVGESKVDAIADLANYCLLYLTWVKEKYPNVFKVWVDRNVPKYLRDKISFLQEQ